MTASATRPETPRTALASALDAPKRPEIQGLRTIAVLLVVLYHLWPSTFSGGYIGVDIFFVISGFLITSHLLREVDATGRVDLARFWARRARRLLPGAYLVLAATAIGIYVWVPRLRWPQFFNEIIASTLYYENWSLAHDAVDYLAESNAASPVQHYWTLSAEEQFYLGWPLLMLLGLFIASRFGARRRVAIAAVLGAVVCGSLVYSLHLTSADSARAYFITPTRAWEFGFGAMLAFVPTTALSRVPTARRAVASWAAITVMIGAGFVFDGATPMPGTGAIVVVVAATAFLAAGGPTQWWAPLAVLDRRAVQFTGEISYALYLWHWPLIILLPYAQGHPNDNRALAGILALAFILATASTFLVENPIRTGRAMRIRVPAVSLTFALLGAVALVAPSAAIRLGQEKAEDRALTIARNIAERTPRCFGAASVDAEAPCSNPDLDRVLLPDPRFAESDRPDNLACASRPAGEPVVPCATGNWSDPSVPKVALIGDSHARMLSSALTALAEQGDLAYDGYFQSGCLWSADAPGRTKYVAECNSFKEKLPALLTDDPGRYDFIVTTGRASKLEGTLDEKAGGLVRAWKTVTDLGIPVVAITDIPEMSPKINECLERARRDEVDACAANRSQVLLDSDPFTAAAAKSPGGRVIDLTPFYCGANTCPVVIGGVTVYADFNHLTATYSRTLAPIIKRELVRHGLLHR